MTPAKSTLEIHNIHILYSLYGSRSGLHVARIGAFPQVVKAARTKAKQSRLEQTTRRSVRAKPSPTSGDGAGYCIVKRQHKLKDPRAVEHGDTHDGDTVVRFRHSSLFSLTQSKRVATAMSTGAQVIGSASDERRACERSTRFLSGGRGTCRIQCTVHDLSSAYRASRASRRSRRIDAAL